MNPTTLSIGHTYIYSTNAGMIEVDYLGPFGPLPDAWHDFAVQSAYQDEIITVSALAVGELLTVSSEQLTMCQLSDIPMCQCAQSDKKNEKISPETVADNVPAPAYMAAKTDLNQLAENSQQLTVEDEKNIPDIAGYPELKTIDIVFISKGGRLKTNTIEGTCVQNAILHVYSYLYREASRGASEIRIHAGGRRVDIHDIRKLNPPLLLLQLAVN